MKITLPEMVEGQEGWKVYQAIPVSVPVPDNRRWHRRAIYAGLIWLHDKAERLWHWAYYTSRQFAPPPSKTDWKHVEIGAYGVTSKGEVIADDLPSGYNPGFYNPDMTHSMDRYGGKQEGK